MGKLTAMLLARRWAPAENLEKIPTIVATASAEARRFGAERSWLLFLVWGALIDVAVIELFE
jgi:hypothetical protein